MMLLVDQRKPPPPLPVKPPFPPAFVRRVRGESGGGGGGEREGESYGPPPDPRRPRLDNLSVESSPGKTGSSPSNNPDTKVCTRARAPAHVHVHARAHRGVNVFTGRKKKNSTIRLFNNLYGDQTSINTTGRWTPADAPHAFLPPPPPLAGEKLAFHSKTLSA